MCKQASNRNTAGNRLLLCDIRILPLGIPAWNLASKIKISEKTGKKFILITRCRFWIKEKLNIFTKNNSGGCETNPITCQRA